MWIEKKKEFTECLTSLFHYDTRVKVIAEKCRQCP